MINWNTDEKNFKKHFPKDYEIWRVTQLINYGLWDGEKLDRDFLLANWLQIKSGLDSESAQAIEFHLWSKKDLVKPGLQKTKQIS